jgi:hypothetical protein
MMLLNISLSVLRRGKYLRSLNAMCALSALNVCKNDGELRVTSVEASLATVISPPCDAGSVPELQLTCVCLIESVKVLR